MIKGVYIYKYKYKYKYIYKGCMYVYIYILPDSTVSSVEGRGDPVNDERPSLP